MNKEVIDKAYEQGRMNKVISSIRLQVYKVLATIDAHQVTNFFARNFFQDEEGQICGGLLKDLIEKMGLSDTMEVFARETGGLSKLPSREELQVKLGIRVSPSDPLLFGMFPSKKTVNSSYSDADDAHKMIDSDANLYLDSAQGSDIMRAIDSNEDSGDEQLDFNQLLRIPMRGAPNNVSPFSDEDDEVPQFKKQKSL